MAKQARRPDKPSPRHAGATRQPEGLHAPVSSAAEPARSSTYFDALGLYEQAVRTIQQHHYSKAVDLLRHVMTRYPEERELTERSRMYLNLCERQLKPLSADPQNTAERLYAATIALNSGNVDAAASHLERILHDEPSHDQALYMLAIVSTAQDRVADAIGYLQQAIEANPENRALARVDPDLDDLRDEDAVMALLNATSAMRADQRRGARRK